jgi:hypothetical protein
VETKHRTYRLECLGGEEVRISGHPSYCPQPIRAQARLWRVLPVPRCRSTA